MLGLFDCFPGFYAYKSLSVQFFNLFSPKQKPRNVLFFRKMKTQSLSHLMTARAGHCENKAEPTLKPQEWAKGLLKELLL